MSHSVPDSLVCPKCHQRLKRVASQLECHECHCTFPIVDGIPVLLCDQAQPKIKVE